MISQPALTRLVVRNLAFLAAFALLGSTAVLAAGNADRGKQKFKATCEVCHLALRGAARNDELTKIGPNLYGVVGRLAGTHKGFRYSTAMQSSGITWTEAQLRRYIQAPQQVIPNVRMSFPGVGNAQDSDDLVAYLATLRRTDSPGKQSAAP
jgi:cytochrome c